MRIRIFPLLLIIWSASNLSSQNNLGQAQQLLQNGKYQEAANLCQQAIKSGEKAGVAYLLLGDVYFQSRKQCGEHEWDAQTTVMLAYHAYEHSIATNNKLAEKAHQKLKEICPYLPIIEIIFNRGLKINEEIEVECWGTTTTIVKQSRCLTNYGE